MINLITRNVMVLMISISTFLFSFNSWAVTVTFDGELLDPICQIDPGSLNQTVQFSEHLSTTFYYNSGKGPKEKFRIRLLNCEDGVLGKTVKLKFNGNKESQMLGASDHFLSVTGVNRAKLAIGLLDTDGKTPLKLGDAHNNHQGTRIDASSLQLEFTAYVQATPDAIANRNIQPGEYTSSVNFEITYE
ncbi:type 1 fimbrial protein [Citrobacter freundii]|nr:type 1 fimbrial protein [Citrobacter freundii]